AGLEIGLVATALALGFRHGFDWDHLAALSDIAASQQSRRRSMMLASMYALGHAAVAFAIRAAVILASAHLPGSDRAPVRARGRDRARARAADGGPPPTRAGARAGARARRRGSANHRHPAAQP